MFGHIPSLPLAGIFGLGTGELVLIILLVLLLFGAKRIPELARGLAKSIQEFKKASKEAETEIRQSLLARALAYTELTDLYEGGVLVELLCSVARSLARAEQGMQQVANLGDLDRCVGEDLDERAAEALPDSLARQAATQAVATARFSRAAGDTVGATVVPVGQIVARDSDGALYATTAAATVPHGSLTSNTVAVVAQTGPRKPSWKRRGR